MERTDQEIALRVGAAIRRSRSARGWSQAALAERADVSLDYVGLVERGERLPSLGMLVRFARVLGSAPADLLGDEVPRHESPARGWRLDVVDALERLPESIRPTIIAMLRAAAETSRARTVRRTREKRRL